jgi:hypothetical protein
MKQMKNLFSFSFFLFCVFFLSCSHGQNDHVVVFDSGIMLPKDTIIPYDPLAITITIENSSINVDFDHTNTQLKNLSAFEKFIVKNNSKTSKKLAKIKCAPDTVVGQLDSVLRILTENHFEKMVLVK